MRATASSTSYVGKDCPRVMRIITRLRSPHLFILVAGTILWAIGCKRSDPAPTPAAPVVGETTTFTDVTARAGITHKHHPPVLDHKLDHIMTWMASVGAAAATADFDRDGWLDLYVTNSRKGQPNFLYRNNHDGTFTDVAESAGVANLNGDDGTSMDCVWADYDNDGWSDLYVVRWGRDVLFRNNGDGTFRDVTKDVFTQPDGRPGTPWANGNSALFLDDNLDGRLDIYVGNYFEEVDLWHLKNTRIMHDDFEKARNGGSNYHYRQQADGTFVDVAKSLGIDDPGWTLSVGSADVDNDGWPDLYCANDFGPDQFFLNDKKGGFVNVTEHAIGWDSKKGMNVDFGDFNNDGWLDIYVTNITTAEYLQEGNMLWHNNGRGEDGQLTLTDVSLETVTYDGGWGWGAKFFDADNDGDLDIIAMNGFISAGEGNFWYDLASWTVTGESAADAANWPPIGDRSFSGYEVVRFWRNDGFYTFTESAKEVGLGSDRDGRGVVTFDYDNDGDLDVFIANQGQAPNLFRNDPASPRHWLMIDVEGTESTATTRDGIGARVTVVTETGMQIRERDGGNSYCGQSDPRMHFGLGDDNRATLVEVRWPDGGLQYVENVAVDRVISVKQDPSQYADRLAVDVGVPKPWKVSEDDKALQQPTIDPADMKRMLTEVEDALRKEFPPAADGTDGAPPTFALASTYRARCAQFGQQDRAVKFFSDLVRQRPSDLRLRIELACTYVDKIPTCGGLAAIVSKGTLARKSLTELDAVVTRRQDLWVARYCRGMNHLHWPRALRHSDDAVVDFTQCIKLQQTHDDAIRPDYYVRAHIALGDSYAKMSQFDKARKAWREGLRLFPESDALKDRLAIADDALLAYVEGVRNLQQPIDTGLAFLDR